MSRTDLNNDGRDNLRNGDNEAPVRFGNQVRHLISRYTGLGARFMLVASVGSALISVTATAATPRQSIVVVGRAIHDNKARLAACLARNCPSDEDIDATLALAEAQLLAGKYRDARYTLLKSLSRNKGEAKSYPIPVSDLYRANGRVAASLGFDEDYYRSTWGIYNTLKKGLPASKDLQYSAMMEVAEMMAATRGHDRARTYYQSIARHARDDGRADIAALAELRMILRHYPAYARAEAIRKIADNADPSTRAAQLEARLALARLAYEENDVAKADALVRGLAPYEIKKPILVYAPKWEVERGPSAQEGSGSLGDRQRIDSSDSMARAQTGSGGRSTRGMDPLISTAKGGPNSFVSARMPLNVEDMWIDVGFRITPEGQVSDVEVLRSRGEKSWAKPLLASIAGRRYTPSKLDGGVYRTERYTYTSGLEAGTASKKAQHSPNARVEYLDLSDITAAN